MKIYNDEKWNIILKNENYILKDKNLQLKIN